MSVPGDASDGIHRGSGVRSPRGIGALDAWDLIAIALAAAGVAFLTGGFHPVGAFALVVAVAFAAARHPSYAVWAVVVLLPVHPLVSRLLAAGGLSGWPFIAVSAWKELALAVALTTLVLSAVARNRPDAPWRSRSALDYLALALIVAVVVAVAMDPGLRSVNGARLMLVPIAAYAALRLSRTPSRALLASLAAVGTLIAAFGIIQGSFLGFDFVKAIYAPPGMDVPATFIASQVDGPRAAATYLSPNEFAMASGVYLAAAVALVARSRGVVTWLTLAVIVLMVGLALSFSRSTILGAGLGVAVVVALGVRAASDRRRAGLALAAALLPAFAIAGIAFAERGGLALLRSSVETIAEYEPSPSPGPSRSPGAASPRPTTSDEPRDSSTIGHIGSLGQGWRLVSTNPFGVGLGNVGARPIAGSSERPEYLVESWYLAMGLSLGWVGLAWAAAFPVVLGLAAWRSLRRDRSAAMPLVAGGVTVLVALVGLVLPTMMEPEVAILPWAVAALVANGARSTAAMDQPAGLDTE